MEDHCLCASSDKDSNTYNKHLKCQQDYLEALASFQSIDDQLICWFYMDGL